MEFKQVIGLRRSIRYFEPDRPVEREKIQVMLEAANRSSRSINADYIKAVVVTRDELDAEVLEQLKTPTTFTSMTRRNISRSCGRPLRDRTPPPLPGTNAQLTMARSGKRRPPSE